MLSSKTLHGRKVLVTGGARRVGREICLSLANLGADVVIHYNRSSDAAISLADEITKLGQKATLWSYDLSNVSKLQKEADEVFEQLSGCNVLINNASLFHEVELPDINEKQWSNYLAVHLLSPFYLSRGFANALQSDRGDIINILDTHASRPRKNFLPYSVSKMALEQLTKSLAFEFAPRVRVNAVAPGYVLEPENSSPNNSAMLDNILLSQRGSPKDVAGAVAYLLSADYVNSEVLHVDGGTIN